ncbi:MAG: hypothetical protein AAGB22_09535, partial [Bacteroidota bacterium]
MLVGFADRPVNEVQQSTIQHHHKRHGGGSRKIRGREAHGLSHRQVRDGQDEHQAKGKNKHDAALVFYGAFPIRSFFVPEEQPQRNGGENRLE